MTATDEPRTINDARPPARTGLELRERNYRGDILIEVSGEVDLLTAPELATHLKSVLDGPTENVIIDLRRVAFADSTAIHVLLNAQRRLTRQSRRLSVVCGEGPVRRLFELTRLDETLGVISTLPD